MASKLDSHEKPNWKTLISKINQTKKMYDEKSILRFYMAILKPRGSPTLELLTDLGRKKKTVGQLITWMNDLGNFPDIVDLLERGEEALTDLKPLIQCQPQSAICETGSDLRLSTEASGQPPLKYQWFKSSYELPNETSNSFYVENVSQQDGGHYTCRVNNDFGYVYTNWSKVDVVDVSPPPPSAIDVLQVPLITMHPRSCTLEMGGVLRLYGDAVADPSPTLQWYHNDKPLLGQCSREIEIENLSEQHEGFYKLQASNKYSSTYSFVAQVTIIKCVKSPNTPPPLEQYSSKLTSSPGSSASDDLNIPSYQTTMEGRGPGPDSDSGISILSPNVPTEKVALVIGNQKYVFEQQLGRLVHPVNDAHDISAELRSLDFKVVSLINLNLTDMRNAVKFFCDLLDSGTYALFYFAGHGFEIEGESYLMPLDASDKYLPEESLSLSEVLFPMTKRRPKLSVVLVDSCRTQPEMCRRDPIPKTWHQSDGLDLQRKNVTIGYGCCAKGRVLESPRMKNGFFALYLLENLSRDVKIDDVMFEVSKGIHQERIIDPVTGRTQVVYRHTTVVDDLRLTDKAISIETTERAALWQQAHIAPESPVTILQNDVVTVMLVFTPDFSNCLVIQSKIVKTESCTSCNVTFILPQTIGGATVETYSPEQKEKDLNIENKFVRISNLERLEGDISIHLEVCYEVNEQLQSQRAIYCIKEKPLYAKVTDQLRDMKI